MAVVNVDLSEYDMLRQNKEKAEAEVKDLKKEIENLKNQSSCVVEVQKYAATIDVHKAAAEIVRLYAEQARYRHQRYDPFGPVPSYNTDSLPDATLLKDCLLHCLPGNTKEQGFKVSSIIKEVRGFSDVADSIKAKLEEQYRAEIEEEKRVASENKELYFNKLLRVTEEVKTEYSEKFKELETKYVEQHKEDEETIKKLREELAEASKSTAEKIADAEDRVQRAIAQLEALKCEKSSKKFSLFKK